MHARKENEHKSEFAWSWRLTSLHSMTEIFVIATVHVSGGWGNPQTLISGPNPAS